MNEHLVEWTLLREKNYLQSCINDMQLEKKNMLTIYYKLRKNRFCA